MSYNITVESGKSVRLTTAGKYCDRDIIITATGGGSADGSYDEGYNDGVNSVLVEFADWSLSATSSSCTVSIANTHPSLYLHLDYEVILRNTDGYGFTESVVVAPNSSYSCDSEEHGFSSLSGAEWDINITGMRFSTDGV